MTFDQWFKKRYGKHLDGLSQEGIDDTLRGAKALAKRFNNDYEAINRYLDKTRSSNYKKAMKKKNGNSK